MARRIAERGVVDAGIDRRVGVVSRLIGVFVVVGIAAVLVRVVDLQADPGPRLSPFVSERQLIRTESAMRGDLLDRRGRVLATSRLGARVVIDPVALVEGVRRNAERAAEDTDVTGPTSIHELIGRLSLAMGPSAQADEIGGRIIGAVARNEAIAAELALLEEDEVFDSTTDLDRLRATVGVFWSRVRGVETVASDQAELAASDGSDEGDGGTKRPSLRRYLPVGEIAGTRVAEAIRAERLPGVWLETWPVRESAAAGAESVVGKVGFEKSGVSGAELTFDDGLEGQAGTLRYARDGFNRPLWVERGGSVAPRRGEDQFLSIDLELQRIALEELTRGVEAAGAAGGRLISIAALTGEVVAMVDVLREPEDAVPFPWVDPLDREGTATARPENYPWVRYSVFQPDTVREIDRSLGRNRAVTDLYEPGSTFKSLVWAAALEAGVMKPGERVPSAQAGYRTAYGRLIEDVTKRQNLDWDGVLVHSSNIGMVILSERLSHRGLRDAVKRFGFGERTGLAVPGEQPGFVTSPENWTDWTQTSVSFGYEVAVTPAQMVRAFGAFARPGELAGTLPPITLEGAGTAGAGAGWLDRPIRRVMGRSVADRAARVMEEVVVRMDENTVRVASIRGEEAPRVSYRLFGKSGTANIAVTPPVVGVEGDEKNPRRRLARPRWAGGYHEEQYSASFIAAGPMGVSDERAPRLVTLVVIDDPSQRLVRLREHYGSWVAGPVNRRFFERALRYLGVPPGAGMASE